MRKRRNIWDQKGVTHPLFSALTHMLHAHRGRLIAFSDMHLRGFCGPLEQDYAATQYVKRDAEFKFIVLEWGAYHFLTFYPDGTIRIAPGPRSWYHTQRKYNHRMGLFLAALRKEPHFQSTGLAFRGYEHMTTFEIGNDTSTFGKHTEDRIANGEFTKEEAIARGMQNRGFKSLAIISTGTSTYYKSLGTTMKPCGRNGLSYYNTQETPKQPRKRQELVKVKDWQTRPLFKSMDDRGMTGYMRHQWDMPKEDGTPGEWHEVDGDLKMCDNGIHVCRASDIMAWTQKTPSVNIVLMEIEGPVVRSNTGSDNKYICNKARVVKVVCTVADVWDAERNLQIPPRKTIMRALKGLPPSPPTFTYQATVKLTGSLTREATARTLNEARQIATERATQAARDIGSISLNNDYVTSKPRGKRVRDGEA